MSNDDDDFAAMFEQSQAGSGLAQPGQKRLPPGKVVEGIVVAVGDEAIFVDVGTRSEGILERRTLAEDATLPAVGDRIRATVAEHPRAEAPPRLVLSLRGRGDIDTEVLEEAVRSGAPVEGEFTRAVKAGIEVNVAGTRAFCPASQVEIGYTGDLEAYVGQNHFFRVMEVKDGGRSVIVSRRALLEAERAVKATALASTLEQGAELEGIVQSVQSYGAFVDLGGITGLVHISEIAHGRIASPGDVVSVGEKVLVKVLSIQTAPSGEAKDNKISLSMRALTQPTAEATPTAEVITATVNKVESFGILIDTPAGGGLVPNNELSLPPGSDPRRAFSPGDSLEVVARGKDRDGRLRFSAKAVAEVEARRAFAQFKGKAKSRSLGSLGDLLAGKFVDLPDRAAPQDLPKKR